MESRPEHASMVAKNQPRIQILGHRSRTLMFPARRTPMEHRGYR
jgi:hypothetical protein